MLEQQYAMGEDRREAREPSRVIKSTQDGETGGRRDPVIVYGLSRLGADVVLGLLLRVVLSRLLSVTHLHCY